MILPLVLAIDAKPWIRFTVITRWLYLIAESGFRSGRGAECRCFSMERIRPFHDGRKPLFAPGSLVLAPGVVVQRQFDDQFGPQRRVLRGVRTPRHDALAACLVFERIEAQSRIGLGLADPLLHNTRLELEFDPAVMAFWKGGASCGRNQVVGAFLVEARSQTARNHLRRSVRLPWKIVPAVSDADAEKRFTKIRRVKPYLRYTQAPEQEPA